MKKDKVEKKSGLNSNESKEMAKNLKPFFFVKQDRTIFASTLDEAQKKLAV